MCRRCSADVYWVCRATPKAEMVRELITNAVEQNDVTVLKLILKQCSNMQRVFSATDADGNTALHHAAHKNHTAAARILLEYSIDVNSKNYQGATCLHTAAQLGHTSIVFLLIDAKADPLLEDRNGKRAVELAIEEQSREALRAYTLKCTELKLLKNMRAWKRLISQDEREHAENMRKVDATIHEALSKSSTDLARLKTAPKSHRLSRTDSGILSDFESDRSRTSSSSSTSKNETRPRKLKSFSFSFRDLRFTTSTPVEILSENEKKRSNSLSTSNESMDTDNNCSSTPKTTRTRRKVSFNQIFDTAKKQRFLTQRRKSTKKNLERIRDTSMSGSVESYI